MLTKVLTFISTSRNKFLVITVYVHLTRAKRNNCTVSIIFRDAILDIFSEIKVDNLVFLKSESK